MLQKELISIETLIQEDKNFCKSFVPIPKHDISSWNSENASWATRSKNLKLDPILETPKKKGSVTYKQLDFTPNIPCALPSIQLNQEPYRKAKNGDRSISELQKAIKTKESSTKPNLKFIRTFLNLPDVPSKPLDIKKYMESHSKSLDCNESFLYNPNDTSLKPKQPTTNPGHCGKIFLNPEASRAIKEKVLKTSGRPHYSQKKSIKITGEKIRKLLKNFKLPDIKPKMSGFSPVPYELIPIHTNKLH
jgi:hypothetical protein